MVSLFDNTSRCVVSFNGRINSYIITDLISKTESLNLKYLTNRKFVVNRIRCIAIEILQNLFDHVENNSEIPVGNKDVEFKIINYSGGLYIICGNTIVSPEAGSLTKRINMINSLSNDELKECYKSALVNSKERGKTGSGRGLLRVAIRSGNKLEFAINCLPEEFYYFRLYSKVYSPSQSTVIQ